MIIISQRLWEDIDATDLANFINDVMSAKHWQRLYPSLNVPNIHIFASSFIRINELNCRVRISFAINGIERTWTCKRAIDHSCSGREIGPLFTSGMGHY